MNEETLRQLAQMELMAKQLLRNIKNIRARLEPSTANTPVGRNAPPNRTNTVGVNFFSDEDEVIILELPTQTTSTRNS